ncbi:histidine phosphatase family protein [Fodinisporobacter ferrooxydans]|uniref:Histidine phosphatase family protein n=1 Tax=Fodinisporobacter ferrooxydans TaxID=2901836 RepID=A0ABY4CI93_9BACL|nr:histidine phosphatase family protein [Alicyclobacillaceae bacterium MYW30-H2]
MKTRILLIRHGETDWNSQRRIQGHTDIPLNHIGLQQARQVANRMRQEAISACYSSDLQRARNTAEHIAKHHGLGVKINERLRERYYGQLEGMTKDEIDQMFPDYQARNHANVGQETLEHVRLRAMQALAEIAERHRGQSVAVVSHGGWINAVLFMISEGKAGTGITHLENTSITTLIREGQLWKIETIGDVLHLGEDASILS